MNRKHFLYVIKIANHDIVKVGVTNSPDQRVATLQTACPWRLYIVDLWSFKNKIQAETAESIAHHIFRANQMRGEWFKNRICATSMASAAARLVGGVKQ